MKIKSVIRSAAVSSGLTLRGSCVSGRGPRVLVLYLFADRRKYPDSDVQVTRLVKHAGDARVVKINNLGNDGEPIIIDRNTVQIAGDNSFWEFSGWKKGLQFGSFFFGEAFDNVLFINDAFLNLSHQGRDLTFYQKRFNRFVFEKLRSDAIGDVSYVKQDHVIKGHLVNQWLKTSIFCMPFEVASKLLFTHLTIDEHRQIIPESFRAGALLNSSPLINDAFKEFVEKWLLERWQWKTEPNPDTWNLLRNKVAAIINERLLSAELTAMGCRMMTATGGKTGVARLQEFKHS